MSISYAKLIDKHNNIRLETNLSISFNKVNRLMLKIKRSDFLIMYYNVLSTSVFDAEVLGRCRFKPWLEFRF